MSIVSPLVPKQLTVLNSTSVIYALGYDKSAVPKCKLPMNTYDYMVLAVKLAEDQGAFSKSNDKFFSFLKSENCSLECAIDLKDNVNETMRNKLNLEFMCNKDGLHFVSNYIPRTDPKVSYSILATYSVTASLSSLGFLSLLAIRSFCRPNSEDKLPIPSQLIKKLNNFKIVYI